MKYLRILFVVLLINLLCVPTSVFADVFAHNVRVTQEGTLGVFDGRFSDGSGVSIRFVLSDHADSVVAVIKDGGTEVRTFTTANLSRGDTSVVWDGKDNGGNYVAAGTYTYSVTLTTYDKGYASYTVLYDELHGIFTRGVTAITNPNLKNFGFIYTADNGGYNGNGTGVMRHANDGTEWGDVKGAAKLTTTGAAINGSLRYSSEADEEGYVYVLYLGSGDAAKVYRYHTDTLNIALIDSTYPTTIRGIGIRGTGSGRYLAVTGDSKVYGFLLGNNSSHFGAKDTLLKADSTEIFYDVTFGRDSMMYATYYYSTNYANLKPGVAKFDLTGYTGTPLKLSDAIWKANIDTGRVTTLKYYKSPAGVASDRIYFVRNQTFGVAGSAVGVYALTNIDNATPTMTQIYVDGSGGNSTARTDVTVDAVGNAIYFENSTENVAIISPPTGANNFTTPGGTFTLKVVNSIPIADAVVDGNNDFVPDSLGKTVTVVGIVNSKNLQGASNTQYTIQDDNAGIMIFKGGAGGPVLNIGDRVVVTGAIAQFNGITEIVPVNFSDIILLDTNNALTPITLTIPQYLADAEAYENRFIKITGIAKKSTSPAWPAAGANQSMMFWDGWDSLVVRIDKDADVDGTTEPTYPVHVQGVGAQFDNVAPFDAGYQIIPNDSADFTWSVSVAPNPHFALGSPASGSTIVVDSAAQTAVFTWNKALDLNGDALIYQWIPVGFSAVTTNADTFAVRSGTQLATILGAKDTVDLKWTVKTKDPSNPIVNNVDTFTVKIIRGKITGVFATDLLPVVFSLEQNFPNPFNPTTTIKYSIPSENHVTLKVFNMLGQEVATLVNEQQSQGYYTATLNASNLSSGVYIYRIEAGSYVSVKKMMFLK